jgi:hypothetical protein
MHAAGEQRTLLGAGVKDVLLGSVTTVLSSSGNPMRERQQPLPAGLPPRRPRPLWSIPLAGKVHPAVWIGAAAAILAVDFLTGPYVQVAILFVFPVALATWSQGRAWGAVVAVALPLVRLPVFYAVWHVPSSWELEFLDTAVDVVVLLALVQIIDHITRQRRELLVLEGMLPICGFCKRIREESGGWRQLESYIAEHSEAKFSHTFCPECGTTHYPDLMQ